MGLDDQAGIVAVVGGVPVPVTPGADGGQGDGAKVPIGDSRNAALIGVDRQRRVDIGLAVIGVGAGRRVTIGGGQSGILLGGRLQGGADPDKHLGAAFAVESAVIGGQSQLEIPGGLVEQLPPNRNLAHIAVITTDIDVLNDAVAPRRGKRHAGGKDIVDQRAV